MSVFPIAFENKNWVSFDATKTKVVFAEDMNYLGDIASLSNQIQNEITVLHSQSDNQSINAGADDKLLSDTIDIERETLWDPTNNEFLIVEEGIYKIRATVLWDGAINGFASFLTVTVNGTAIITSEHDKGAPGNRSQSVEKTVYLVPEDTICVLVNHAAGSAKSLISGSKYNEYWLQRVA